MRKLSILFSLLFLVPAFAGEITGRVYNQKTKASLGKVPLRLHAYKEGYEFFGSETMTDASGQYRFRNLETDDRFEYLVYPIIDNINYPYQELAFTKGSYLLKQDFPITESTGSTEDIAVDESIFFEFGKKDIWKITHEILLENKGDTLYHSDRGDARPLLFSLFEGGFDLSYLDGITRNNSKIDEEKDTLQTFLTIAGHETAKIRFSYYYLPTARHVAFNRDAYLQRSNVTLFFKNNIRIASNQFQSDPMMLRGHEDFTRAYTSGPIKQNEKITFEISGFFLQGDLLHILVLAAAMAFIAIIVYWAIRQKRSLKNQSNNLTEKMHRYLMDLRKQRKEGILDEHQYKKEDHRVRNFLFQASKVSKK